MIAPKLRIMEGLPLNEWLKKAVNAEMEFAPKKGDDPKEIEKKESLKRWNTIERF